MKTRILYTGITGLIGRYFQESNPDPDRHLILGVARSERPGLSFRGLHGFAACDVSDLSLLRQTLAMFKPDVVIHAAGEGNVDAVEKDPTRHADVSSRSLALILEESHRLKARVIHFSSNAVYDGEHAPYSEDSPPNPVNAYGKMKVALDADVRRYPGDWTILRPIISYGWNHSFARTNPVSAFVPKILAGEKLRVVDDQWENPVYAGDVAGVLWRILEQGFSGDINVAGGDVRISRYDWIRTVARVFDRPDADIERAKMADFATMAPRPRDTSFDVSKLRNELKYAPMTVEEGVLAMRRNQR